MKFIRPGLVYRWFPAAAVAVCIAFLLPAAGCAQFERTAGVYQSDLGRAPSTDMMVNIVHNQLESFGYQVQDVTRSQLRTDWRERNADAAIGLPGAARIRDQALVSYSSRGQSYTVARLRMQFQVLRDGQWQAADVPKALEEEYRRLEGEIEQELERYMTQN